MPKKIVLVGGSGFIGDHLTTALLAYGHSVTILDVKPPAAMLAPTDRCRYISYDVWAPISLTNCFEACDVVYLLAAKLGKGCHEDPVDGWQTNVVGLSHTLNAIQRSQSRPRLVFASSCMVYRLPSAKLPIDEDSALGASDPYGWSKIAGEAMLQYIAVALELEVVIMRPFSVYGPGSKATNGHFLATWIESALREGTIKIFGTGEQTVDLIHVSDAVRVMVAFSNTPDFTPGRAHIYNLGTGVEIQVREVARWLQAESKELRIEYVAEKSGVVRTVAAIDRISADFDFKPQHDTEMSIRQWFRRAMQNGSSL